MKSYNGKEGLNEEEEDEPGDEIESEEEPYDDEEENLSDDEEEPYTDNDGFRKKVKGTGNVNSISKNSKVDSKTFFNIDTKVSGNAANNQSDNANVARRDMMMGSSVGSSRGFAEARQPSDAELKAIAVRQMLASGGPSTRPGVQNIPAPKLPPGLPPRHNSNSSSDSNSSASLDATNSKPRRINSSNENASKPPPADNGPSLGAQTSGLRSNSNMDIRNNPNYQPSPISSFRPPTSMWLNHTIQSSSMTSIPESEREDDSTISHYSSSQPTHHSLSSAQNQSLLSNASNSHVDNSTNSNVITTAVYATVDTNEQQEISPFTAQIVEDEYVIEANAMKVIDEEEEEYEFEQKRKRFIKKVILISFLSITVVVAATVPLAIYFFRKSNDTPPPSYAPSMVPSTAPTGAQFAEVVETLSSIYYPIIPAFESDIITTEHPMEEMEGMIKVFDEANMSANDDIQTLSNMSSNIRYGHNLTLNMNMNMTLHLNVTKKETKPDKIRLLDKARLEDLSSPQYKAVKWLSSTLSASFTHTSPNFVQRYILAVFYFSLSGDKWAHCNRDDTSCIDNKYHYLSDESECQWYGNQCAHDDGKISQIFIANNKLLGSIPTEITFLSSIEFLYLPNNRIYGTLPTTFHHLTKLKQIRLENNLLEGPIPKSLFATTSLEVVSLFYNRINGTIPNHLGNMESLRKLYLQMNRFTGQIPISLGDLKQLEDIVLSFNKLNGTVPERLFEIRSLKKLILSHNELSGQISWKVGQLPNLKAYNVSHNNLIGKIPFEIYDSSSLEILDVSNNEINGDLSAKFEYMTTLRHLHLEVNAFGGNVPTELGNLNLVSFQIHGNRISGRMPEEICEKRGPKARDLQVLTADCSDTSRKIVCDVPRCCSHCF